ncbi:MAG: D-cysteine desulfhydrase [Methylobacteriaceae bacterium]|jgi:D-cysteine desulfhydrase|nr:D-cysteine desulfhydrase [Methylobacteriaceae bacterium]
MNLAKLPRRNYVTAPTRIDYAANLTKLLGGPEIYIKRDDELPGAGGGNKTRKLDFVIADALLKGADALVTCGAVQSNHCRLTLAWARREKLQCHFVLEERVPGSYHEEASGNNFLYQLLGVDSIKVVEGGSDVDAAMYEVAERLKAAGKKPYIIPGGASNAVGASGYVVFAEELLRQSFELQLSFDHIVVPSGSAGTHAGTLTGIIGANAGIPVHGITVSRPRDVQEEKVYQLAQETAELLGVKGGIPREAVRCYDDYYQPGYSRVNDGMLEAVTLFAREEGILLDPVYTGKQAAGFIDLIRKGVFKKGEKVLFAHTGGAPALYMYLEPFREWFKKI